MKSFILGIIGGLSVLIIMGQSKIPTITRIAPNEIQIRNFPDIEPEYWTTREKDELQPYPLVLLQKKDKEHIDRIESKINFIMKKTRIEREFTKEERKEVEEEQKKYPGSIITCCPSESMYEAWERKNKK